MLLVFKLFWGIAILELLLWLVPRLAWRRLLAPFIILGLSITSVALFVVHPSLPTGILLLVSAYRLCSLLRVVRARVNEKYLQRAAVQASVWLIGVQAGVVLLWGLVVAINATTYHLWLVLMSVDLAGGLILLASTMRHLRTTRVPVLTTKGLADRDLPTLTVAIPARNETDALEACLESLIASTYPKLEVIVLDDCSQNKQTPEIIRGFAHDGVRFIQGRVPEENWLAKNQAYQRLLEESNGELVLFCGVDVRFQPNSLRALVAALLQKNKSMISIIPENSAPGVSLHDSTLVQPMRYAWELAFPRRMFSRPPVLSTCWIIKRDTLLSAGGFAAVSRSIVPESYFARVCTATDGYSFMQSDQYIGITSLKSFSDQIDTAVRTRYPQVHRRIELVLLLTLAELMAVLLPTVLLLGALFGRLSLMLTLLSAVTLLLLLSAYVQIVTLTYRRWLTRSWFLLPIAAVFDIVLLNLSMVRYEFFSVVWKGRNVCIPVMRVVSHLPLPDSSK